MFAGNLWWHIHSRLLISKLISYHVLYFCFCPLLDLASAWSFSPPRLSSSLYCSCIFWSVLHLKKEWYDPTFFFIIIIIIFVNMYQYYTLICIKGCSLLSIIWHESWHMVEPVCRRTQFNTGREYDSSMFWHYCIQWKTSESLDLAYWPLNSKRTLDLRLWDSHWDSGRGLVN